MLLQNILLSIPVPVTLSNIASPVPAARIPASDLPMVQLVGSQHIDHS